MATRDQGQIKWQPASFPPLAFEMQRSMFKDQERQPYGWRFLFGKLFNFSHKIYREAMFIEI